MADGHGGNLRALAERSGRAPGEILDFSANINPLGPSECLHAALARSVDDVAHYPDPDSVELVDAIAKRYEMPQDHVVVGNGASEILHAVARALSAPRALIPVPTYIDYARAAARAGSHIVLQPLRASDGFALCWADLEANVRSGDMVIIGQPNNPTGLLEDRARLRAFAEAHPGISVIVDEAFADFVPGYESIARNVQRNVIVVRSLTKFYAVPGLRLGFAVAQPEIAERIREQVPPWSVNILAQAAGTAMLADEDYARQTVEFVRERRTELSRELGALPGLYVYPGVANYLLARIDRADMDATTLAERLLDDGIAIRTFGGAQHLDRRFFRVAVRTAGENARLCQAIRRVLRIAPANPVRRPTPAIMFQGTSSNAGKSVLTAALCRILLQDGWRVAPFKAQNMSLNSFVTQDGGEMGRAQVVQARACRLEPDVRMNPILLKPTSDVGSQVICRGKPVGNMRVDEYVRFKPEAFAAAKECYDALAAECDVMVLEGAGSPGEVNLKHHDIVNMRMAEYAQAPVVIVGDIDRGGVFASFVGTMDVLVPWERRLVAGWIVNRFRGDPGLLAPALEYTRQHTGRPVLGVVPFLHDLRLPEEDSVEFKSGSLDDTRAAGAGVEIAVIDLPHIANFTDIDPFRAEPDVRLRIVRRLADLGKPDAVLIPGSKNTLGDLAYLRESGLAERLYAMAAGDGAELVGICGGLQILGCDIDDPHEIESGAGRARGLALLPVDTTLEPEKTLVRTWATHVPSSLPVAGYEIHHGRTPVGDALPILTSAAGHTVGVAAPGGRIWGTYLHGIFDADEFRRWFIDRLRVRRKLPPVGRVCAAYEIDSALDRLASVVRECLDMAAIYKLLGMK